MSPLAFRLLRSKISAITKKLTEGSANARFFNVQDSESVHTRMPRIGTSLRQSFVARGSALRSSVTGLTLNSMGSRNVTELRKADPRTSYEVVDFVVASMTELGKAVMQAMTKSTTSNDVRAPEKMTPDERKEPYSDGQEAPSSCSSEYGSSCSSGIICLGARKARIGGRAKGQCVSRPALNASAQKADSLIGSIERHQLDYWMSDSAMERQRYDERETISSVVRGKTRYFGREGDKLTAKNLSKVKKAKRSFSRTKRWANMHKVCDKDFVHLGLKPGNNPGERVALSLENISSVPMDTLSSFERTTHWVQGLKKKLSVQMSSIETFLAVSLSPSRPRYRVLPLTTEQIVSCSW